MSITDSQSVSFGLLAMYAEDMYDAAVGSLNPAADPRIATSGWTIVGYLTALDALIAAKGAPVRGPFYTRTRSSPHTAPLDRIRP